jgi:hypothetical protein
MLFLPKPLSDSSEPAPIAAFKSSRLAICNSFQSTAAFFGPSPPSFSRSSTLSGISSASSSRSELRPVSSNS